MSTKKLHNHYELQMLYNLCSNIIVRLFLEHKRC